MRNMGLVGKKKKSRHSSNYSYFEKMLVLNSYFLNLFNFNNFDDLCEKLKDIHEGYTPEGISFFIDTLIQLNPEWEIELLRYDEAIKEYVGKLRKNRRRPNFNLRYFQYLAVLFTEIFLDRYYNHREQFLSELNQYLKGFNSSSKRKSNITHFTEEDLRKLAFWMATGSGKTIIMHINYWQILKYLESAPDNILLITPNEGLSKQHYEEFKLSGIQSRLYDGNINALNTMYGEILIIDIYKLTENKTGEGVSIDISYFEGKNLVFIDEGHKGQKSLEQKWKNLREEIGKSGFIFEYSATFGQVIGKNKSLLEEYAKAIIFNYSYKYFYTDGYGKDFYVYNIKESGYTEVQRNLLLTAGLLSFYEQLRIFNTHKDALRRYNIEKPLWVFVGSKVTGKGLNSDVVKVILFLNKITEDRSYLEGNITKVLTGNSGLIDLEGNDIFGDKFIYIRKMSLQEIVEDIYKIIFNGRGKLELQEITKAEGEIGLKTRTGDKYFGVINVGNISALKKLIGASGISGLEVKSDHFSQSLFFDINQDSSNINILIGSKKFVEGWNSWRVSNMLLINMGKTEGPQIIQLFGRGVRIKGQNYSLKREENPDYKLKIIQTLFIFGLNAEYINAFLTTIAKEDLIYKERLAPIKINTIKSGEDRENKEDREKREDREDREDRASRLNSLKSKEGFNFINYPIKLELDSPLLNEIRLDLRPKMTITHGLKTDKISAVMDKPLKIPKKYLNLIDWELIYSEIMNYKYIKAFFNLLIDKDVLKQIILSQKYQIFMSDISGIRVENQDGVLVLNIISFEGLLKFHEIITMVLKKYISKFYGEMKKRKLMEFLTSSPGPIR